MNWIRIGDHLVNLAQATDILLDTTVSRYNAETHKNEKVPHGVKILFAFIEGDDQSCTQFSGDRAEIAREAIVKALGLSEKNDQHPTSQTV